MASRIEDDLEKQQESIVPAATLRRRVERLLFHLSPSRPLLDHRLDHDHSSVIELLNCAGRTKKIEVNKDELSRLMRGTHRDIQEKVFDYFKSRPELQTPIEISMDEHRELCYRQLVGLVREANIRPFRYVVEDPAKYFAFAEAVGSVDMSLGIKMGVQYR